MNSAILALLLMFSSHRSPECPTGYFADWNYYHEPCPQGHVCRFQMGCYKGTEEIVLEGGSPNSTFLSFSGPKHHRSPEVRRQFMHLHPCPSTHNKYGSCPGFVVDHVIPLACGGPDAVSNMAWQTIADGKAKDKIERKNCRKN